ncbi:hypothetical protein F66182_7603 [Fusarium sp. NRRL 66182]|nr:hypothetical protein F66182_7603 [Fusarium sp. NRRL 66182]
MSSSDNATKSSARRSMGNFANEEVDRSEAAAQTRKQKRQERRQTLRNQSEVAPFLGMDLSDEETEKKSKDKDISKDKDDKKETAENVIDDPYYQEIYERGLEEKTQSLRGLSPTVFRAPPSGESEFCQAEENSWRSRLFGISIRTWMIPGFT